MITILSEEAPVKVEEVSSTNNSLSWLSKLADILLVMESADIEGY